MQDKAIVKVEVTEWDQEVTYGTAYFINRTHAITALHVVQNYQAIKFYFTDGTETSEFKPCYSNPDFDIALLTFSEKKSDLLPKIHNTELSKVESGDQWYGVGYPKFAEEEGGCRQLEQLPGKCCRCADDATSFDIKCDKDPILKEWGGASGTPVFVAEKLVGVIGKLDNRLRGAHFSAGAIWNLFGKDEQFKSFFIYENKSEKVLNKAQAYLEDPKNADLYDELNGNSKLKASDIVNGLVKKELADMLASLKGLSTATGKITDFIMILLPWYFVDQAIVIDEEVIGLCENAIDIKCISDVAAEFSVAAFSGRGAHVECFSGGNLYDEQLRVSQGRLALAPEAGIAYKSDDMDNFTNHILAGSALDELLTSRFPNKSFDPETWTSRVLKKAKQDGNHFYLVVKLDEKSSDCLEKIKQIKKYKEKYPDLIILNLASPVEDEREYGLFLNLPALMN